MAPLQTRLPGNLACVCFYKTPKTEIGTGHVVRSGGVSGDALVAELPESVRECLLVAVGSGKYGRVFPCRGGFR